MTKGKKLVSYAFMVIFFGVMAACASYPELSQHVLSSDDPQLRPLEEHWQEYSVSYAGLNNEIPAALMFEPKGDGKDLVGDGWHAVKSETTLKKAIHSIRDEDPISFHYPRLWQISGSGGHVYGYVLTSWGRLPMKVNELPRRKQRGINRKPS